MATMYNASRLRKLIALLITGYFLIHANGNTYIWTFGNRKEIGCTM